MNAKLYTKLKPSKYCQQNLGIKLNKKNTNYVANDMADEVA